MTNVEGHQPAAGSSRVPLVFMAGVFLLLGILFLAITGNLLLTERSYRQEGVRTEAVVTGKALRPATADSDTEYQVTYRFAQADGSPAARTEAASVHQWERVGPGSRITIEYVPGQPASARLLPESAEEMIVTSIMAGVGALLALIGLALLVSAFRRRPAPPPTVETPGPERAHGFPAPPAASGSRERSAWQLAWRSFGVLFGGIFLICGLPFFIIGCYLFYDDWTFAREARATQGMVLTKDIRTTSSGSGSSRSKTRHYEVTYRFAAGGATHEGKDELSRSDWLRLEERKPVEVRYRPQRPASNHLAARNGWVLKTIFTLLGSLFAGIGGTVFVRGVRGARLEARLRRHGVTTHGTVVALRPRNVKINRVPQWRLEYEYRDYQGQRQAGTADMPADDAEAWQAGDTGRILYDQASPARSVWLGRDA